MKKIYKISEVANLFNISRQTLIFYHKKGILNPMKIDDSNGYRYYSDKQIWELMFILSMKKAGFSLEEIKKVCELKSAEKSLDFFRKKVVELEEKIEELIYIKEKMKRRIEGLEEHFKENDRKIKYEQLEDIYWYFIDLKDKNNDKEIIGIYTELERVAKKNSVRNINFVHMICLEKVEEIEEKEMLPVLKIGIIVEKDKRFEGCERLKIGRSYSVNYNENYELLTKRYKEINEKVRDKNEEIKGYALEFSKELTFTMADGIGGIMKIVVPIK